MSAEEWIAVEIGGYRRYVPESKLPQVYEDAKVFIDEYVQMGIDRNYVENLYKVELVVDKEQP